MMLRTVPTVQVSMIVAVAVVGSATAAVAQDRKWEVEVHGGGTVATSPTGGTAALLAAGTLFSLPPPPGGLPPGAPALPTSRRESSWYFGDGAVLVNQVNTAQVSIGLGVTGKITPLDPVMNSSVARRQTGGSIGFRISRHITPRYTAEFNFDYSRGRLEMGSAGLAGIEASRASFISAFNALVVAGLPKTVTSTATIHSSEGRQIFTTGVLNINLKTDGKIVPYATVGGGVVVNSGNTPSATLTGTYRIVSSPLSPFPGVLLFNETDTVNLRYSIEHRAFVGVLGGGIKYAVSPRWGVRLDVRAHLSKNSVSNLVDANPTVATLTPAESLSALGVNPTIFVSNNPSRPVQSSLSGPAISGFRTFAGNGMQTQISIVPGFFWRF